MKLIYKLTLLLILIFSFNIFFTDNTRAQADPPADGFECLVNPLAEYVDSICKAKEAGKFGSNLKLLSPAFNMTAGSLNPIISGLNTALPGWDRCLDGYAGNIYNRTSTISETWAIQNIDSITGKPWYITETGAWGNSEEDINRLVPEMAFLRGKSNAQLLFNAFGTNPSGSFQKHVMNDDQIRRVCGGGSCGETGINFGTYFKSGDYGRASGLGMGWALEISKPDNFDQTLSAINGENQTIIVRIGTGAGGDGFEDVDVYIDYLARLSRSTSKTFYAIAGPNEPGDEMWIAPGCNLPYYSEECGKKPEFDKVARPMTVIGPFKFVANGMSHVKRDWVAQLHLQLTAGNGGSYEHPLLQAITVRTVGKPDDANISENLRRYNNAEFSFYRAYTNQKPVESSYLIPEQPPRGENEDLESFVKRTYPETKTNEPGIEATMPGTALGCVQLVPPEGFNPKDESTYGHLFFVEGDIKFNEAGELNSGTRSANFLSRMIAGMPGESKLDPKQIARLDKMKKIDYYAENSSEKFNQLALEINTDYVPSTPQKKEYAAKNNVDLNNGNTAYAYEPVEGSLENFLVPNVTGGGGIYNIGYKYCIYHHPPCGMGDLQSYFNGIEVNRWGNPSTSSEYPKIYGTCLEQGWGDAPFFNGIDLSGGKKWTLSVMTQGNKTGPAGLCPNSVGLSCTFWEEKNPETGKMGVKSTCGGFVQEPPPVNCHDCKTWAPLGCSEFNAEKIVKDPECLDGKCEQKAVFRESASCRFNLLECIKDPEDPLGKCIEEIGDWLSCFGGKEMWVYFAPSAMGNYESFLDQTKMYEALFKVPGRTEDVFEPRPTKENLPLQVNVAGQYDDEIKMKSADGVTGEDTEVLYKDYETIAESHCLMNETLIIPGNKWRPQLQYEDELCQKYDFWRKDE